MREIVVPGSVANLGGGFDTLAVAVELYLRVRITEVHPDGGGQLTVVRSRPPVTGENAVERGFAALAQRAGTAVPSVSVEVESDIPMAAGLGSSAAATVAGLRVFEAVTGPMSEGVLLAAATGVEGHADNAAAALLGGLTSVVDGETRAVQWPWPEDLRLVVATPSGGLATSRARAALAPVVSQEDAVFNLQRVLSFVHALQHKEYGELREAMRDRWHQSARSSLVPHLDAVLAIDDPDVLGACLSGAGPSVAVLARRDFERVERLLRTVCEAAGSTVTVRTLGVHRSGEKASSVAAQGEMASAHGRT